MPSNFDFLRNRFPNLLEHALQAEQFALSAPRASCFYARFTLEQAVHWLYANDAYLRLPYSEPKHNTLAVLIHEQTFKDNLKPGLFPKIRNIHKLGNLAVHEATPISTKEALILVESLFQFLYWLCRYYTPNGKSLGEQTFNRDLIPRPATQKPQDLSLPQLQALKEQLSQADEMRRIAEERQRTTQEELEALKAEYTALKQQNAVVPDTHNYDPNEAETRRVYIDALLKEAGWPVHLPDWTEVEVLGMPNDSGKGYVDYVLWGDNGKPLAVVEAKRTSKNPQNGQHQAKLYADCLENQYGQRPVIFYSNGYNTWIWDDVSYPPREIQGFLKKEELERLIFRRTHRTPLNLVQISSDIIDRSYQREAILRITETFHDQKGRKALLVMATGTGKTRTAVALVDLLMRANWVKRVLFLADRTALLTQALRAFKRYLPNATAIDLTRDRAVEGANVVLSTYPTMFNAINRNSGGEQLFGPGYFDLVIVDEAHRSIYKRYGALFDYFDALLVGLTATPRDDVHRDTYRIFELEKGNPTFAYELADAIADGHLVPSRGLDIPFKFQRSGVKYRDLSPEEREEYEEKLWDEETNTIPDQVNAAAMNDWLFNIPTVDQALEILMQHGLKIQGGDLLGKTIIFARNQNHARFIVERFDANYPHYKGQFAQVIHSDISNAQSLLNDFSDPSRQPTIAVSVDMLDTGVDVPEVVNLVFFKPVYSPVKFNQMLGRGTRLCPDLFGVGLHKTEFLVFDLCGNCEFFEQEIEAADPKPIDSLTARLVKSRLELAQHLKETGAGNPNHQVLRDTLLDELHRHVASMEPNNFVVRRHLQTVEAFSQRDRWNQLSETDLDTIADTLAHLPNGLPSEDRLAKEFDALCLKLQIALLKQSTDFVRLRDQVRDLFSPLLGDNTKRDLPMVKEQLPLLEEVQDEAWWTDVTPSLIENLRLRLRNLVKFIDRKQQAAVYTNFKDELGVVREVNVPTHQTGFSPHQYRRKVEAYIRANEGHVAIAKLKRNLPLTPADLAALESMLFESPEIESRERFEEVFGKGRSLALFIRQLVGLDRNAAKETFSAYLEGRTMTANQIRFVETIIDYLTQNGVMAPEQLYKPPFSEFHSDGLDGLFLEEDADMIVHLVQSFNETVGFTAA